jgi:hypothetical protein
MRPSAAVIASALVFAASTVCADPLTCNMSEYKAQPGLTAAGSNDTLLLTWDGDRNGEARLRLALDNGTPVIRE